MKFLCNATKQLRLRKNERGSCIGILVGALAILDAAVERGRVAANRVRSIVDDYG